MKLIPNSPMVSVSTFIFNEVGVLLLICCLVSQNRSQVKYFVTGKIGTKCWLLSNMCQWFFNFEVHARRVQTIIALYFGVRICINNSPPPPPSSSKNNKPYIQTKNRNTQRKSSSVYVTYEILIVLGTQSSLQFVKNQLSIWYYNQSFISLKIKSRL